jgi:hypothetical protein
VMLGGPSLYLSDVTCCWRVNLAAGGSTLVPLGSCAAVRQDEYPYIASFSYSPPVGVSRQERLTIQCCQDRTLAPSLCTASEASYRGQATVTIVTNTANSPPPPPVAG